MERERQNGKRVMPAQQGTPKKRTKKKGSPLVPVLIVLAVLVAAYAGLTAWVAMSNQMLPNTTVGGIELGGLDRAEALAKVEQEAQSRCEAISISFTCGGTEFTVPGSDLTADGASAVNDAWQQSRSGNLLSGGIRYLGALFGVSKAEVDLPLRFDQTPQAILDAESHITNGMVETTYTVTDTTLELTHGTTGQAIDIVKLEEEILAQFQDQLNGGEAQPPIDVPVTTEAPPEPDFQAIYDAVYKEPADATLDKTTKEIVPSVTGVSFDIEAAKAALEGTEEGETVSVPLTLTEPAVTTAKLEANLFSDVLGKASTRTTGDSNRIHNVDLACQRVNGTILLPGEVFSYNALCGPYSQSGGYLKAGAYVGGATTPTWAGGVCQLSSTIYYTTLKANLETVERSKHKYDVGYLPSGMDATVYSDSLDFKFKNSTDYPIKIVTSLTKSNGTRYCNVTIYGTNTTGVYGDPYSVVVSTTQPKTVYEPSSSVPQGSAPQKDSTRTAYTGKVVEVHQRLRDANGNVISDTVIHTDRFDARDAVYLYNPADADLWGIDPSTGLKTKTPTAPSTTPTPSTAPSTTPTPTPSVAPSATPSPTPSAAPSAAQPSATPTTAPSDSGGEVVLPPEAENR